MKREREQPPAPIPFEHVISTARERLLRDGYHLPTLIVDGHLHPIILQINTLAPTHDERLAQMHIAGMAMAQDGRAGRLRRVFFISEAWISEGHDNKPPVTPPSQDPNRKEILVVAKYEASIQRFDMVITEMIRDENGILRELRELRRSDEKEEHVESSLLQAFIEGFSSRDAFPES